MLIVQYAHFVGISYSVWRIWEQSGWQNARRQVFWTWGVYWFW